MALERVTRDLAPGEVQPLPDATPGEHLAPRAATFLPLPLRAWAAKRTKVGGRGPARWHPACSSPGPQSTAATLHVIETGRSRVGAKAPALPDATRRRASTRTPRAAPSSRYMALERAARDSAPRRLRLHPPQRQTSIPTPRTAAFLPLPLRAWAAKRTKGRGRGPAGSLQACSAPVPDPSSSRYMALEQAARDSAPRRLRPARRGARRAPGRRARHRPHGTWRWNGPRAIWRSARPSPPATRPSPGRSQPARKASKRIQPRMNADERG